MKYASTAVAAALCAAALVFGACAKNPYDYATWTEKLDNPKELDDAVTRLEQLGDPKAIPALAKAFERHGKPTKILTVIIGLARPLNEDQYEKVYYQRKTREANWDLAKDVLISAVTDVEEANPRSIEQAIKAADALADSGLKEGLKALIDGVGKSYKKAIPAQQAMVRAIGRFKDPSAIAPLSQLLGKEGVDLLVRAEAVNAVGAIGSADSLPILLRTMYEYKELFEACRRAIALVGPTAGGELRKVLRGEHTAINQLFAEKKLDQFCIQSQCEQVSLRDYYAAIVLGDLYDPASVPDLVAALGRPAKPAYYVNDQPGPVQHMGIIDALRRIGSAEAAEPLKALWSNASGELPVRIAAMSAYSFTARDTSALGELAVIFKTDSADQGLRLTAAEAYARLARSSEDIAPLLEMAKRYEAESKKRLEEANGAPKAAFDQAKAEMDAKKKEYDAAKNGDPKAAEAAKAVYATAKAAYQKAEYGYKPLVNTARDYTLFQRTFETHAARIVLAKRCGNDAACYAKTLTAKPDDIVPGLAEYLPTIKDTWTKDEKKDLVGAQIERGMAELAKMGSSASAQTPDLLAAAKTDDSLVRQSILLALAKIAPRPCPECVEKLDAAFKATEGKSTAKAINFETQVLRNFFASLK